MIPYKVVENEDGSIVSIERLSDDELIEFEYGLSERMRTMFRKYGSFSVTPANSVRYGRKSIDDGVVIWIIDMSNSFELLPPTHYIRRIVNVLLPYLRDEIIDQII